MNSTPGNREPKSAWGHHTQSYNTESSRLQLGVSPPGLHQPPGHPHAGPAISMGSLPPPPTATLRVDPTPFFMAIMVRLPTFLISSANYTFDPGVVLSRTGIGAISGNAHPTHVDLFQDTLITTTSPALAVQALLTRIYQIAYYQQLVKLQSPVAAETAFSLTATIPVQWTGFALASALIGVHSLIIVALAVQFASSTDISFVGSYYQTVAQVISPDTRPILDEADRMDDAAVTAWAELEELGSLGSRSGFSPECWGTRHVGTCS